MSNKGNRKGAAAEEILREYFLGLGYFAVRGIKFKYQEFDITDVDLWLYKRPSPLIRDRTIVDVKRKRTPQAIERIFWTKGLQTILGLEHAIVATTDKRTATREFGLKNNVAILDGSFLDRLQSRVQPSDTRLTEEELHELLKTDPLNKLKGNWWTKLEKSKSLLLSNLDFSVCNMWLMEIACFAEQAFIDLQRQALATRLMYLHISYFLLGLDYIFKDLSFVDVNTKSQTLKDGFTYGSKGEKGIEDVLKRAITLVEAYLPEGRKWSVVLRKNAESALEQIQADILKEYFGRSEVYRSLFDYALDFEKIAYTRDFVIPTNLDNELKSIVAVLLDFSQIERRKFFDSFSVPETS